jgi:hypothetical protein
MNTNLSKRSETEIHNIYSKILNYVTGSVKKYDWNVLIQINKK